MTVILRRFSTRTDGKVMPLASLEQGSKHEFIIRDGQVVIQTLPAAEKQEAKILYEALRDRLMDTRKPD